MKFLNNFFHLNIFQSRIRKRHKKCHDEPSGHFYFLNEKEVKLRKKVAYELDCIYVKYTLRFHFYFPDSTGIKIPGLNLVEYGANRDF